MTMMNRECEDVRTDILNFLLDVKNQQDTKLGPIYVQIPGRLGGNLMYQEFWAQVASLEASGLISSRPVGNNKHYMITKMGVEVLQGKTEVIEKADQSTMGISFNVAGDYNAHNSPVTIASSGTCIEVKITHSKANELDELFKQLELSIKDDVSLPEDAKTVRTYLTSLQDVLSLSEEEQDKSVLESIYQKLWKKLQTYERPLAIVGSIASILGLGVSLT